MKNRFIVLLPIVLALVVVGAADAQENQPLTSKIIEIDSQDTRGQGMQLCKDNEQAMSACRSFIKGFIQGALLTDTAIIRSIEKTQPTYAERAIRTRLGTSAGRSPTALAGFCLPEDRTILELAEETLDHVKDEQRNSSALAKRVYASLQVDYPCS